jgi:hypothetical protein
MKLPSILLLSLFFGLSAQLPAQPQEQPSNVVPGLELPAPQKVPASEGFVLVEAKTQGTVHWLVLGSGPRVKYLEAEKQCIVSVPAEPCTVQVFAVALVDGKITPFARTSLTVEGARPPPGPAPNPQPGPTPNPTPNPTPPVTGRLHLTLVLDFDKLTPQQAQLLNSPTLRQAFTQQQVVLRTYPPTSPVLAQRKLDSYVQKVGGAPALILQSDDGKVVASQTLPGSEQEVLAVIAKLRKGG